MDFIDQSAKGDEHLQSVRREVDDLHDPLTVVLGNLQVLLRDDQLDGPLRERLVLIELQTQRLRGGVARALELVDNAQAVR